MVPIDSHAARAFQGCGRNHVVAEAAEVATALSQAQLTGLAAAGSHHAVQLIACAGESVFGVSNHIKLIGPYFGEQFEPGAWPCD